MKKKKNCVRIGWIRNRKNPAARPAGSGLLLNIIGHHGTNLIERNHTRRAESAFVASAGCSRADGGGLNSKGVARHGRERGDQPADIVVRRCQYSGKPVAGAAPAGRENRYDPADVPAQFLKQGSVGNLSGIAAAST